MTTEQEKKLLILLEGTKPLIVEFSPPENGVTKGDWYDTICDKEGIIQLVIVLVGGKIILRPLCTIKVLSKLNEPIQPNI